MKKEQIVFNYRRSPNSPERLTPSVLRDACVEDIFYEYFLGDIYISVAGARFDADWGWVPIIDFGICLRAIAKVLCEGENHSELETFEFTESDAALHFLRQGREIRVSSNYSSEIGKVSLKEFDLATKQLAQRLYEELLKNDRHLPLSVKDQVRKKLLN